ncbi:MAG: hypothetical protein AB1898_02645 [Acidobacteriota bacterium]
MSTRFDVLVLLVLLCSSSNPLFSQNLVKVAAKERQRRSQLKTASPLYTNQHLRSSRSTSVLTPLRQEHSVDKASVISNLDLADRASLNPDAERSWSARFIALRQRLEQSLAREAQLNRWMAQLFAGCGPETDYDWNYFAYVRRELEQTAEQIALSRQLLARLREDLRKSGQPASWEYSRLAEKIPPEPLTSPPQAEEFSERYWQERLSQIDEHYGSQVNRMRQEAFEMRFGRPPRGESELMLVQSPEPCTPPFALELISKISAVEGDHEQARTDLREEARKKGALPGWFR